MVGEGRAEGRSGCWTRLFIKINRYGLCWPPPKNEALKMINLIYFQQELASLVCVPIIGSRKGHRKKDKLTLTQPPKPSVSKT
jgi:hypothetical protein